MVYCFNLPRVMMGWVVCVLMCYSHVNKVHRPSARVGWMLYLPLRQSGIVLPSRGLQGDLRPALHCLLQVAEQGFGPEGHDEVWFLLYHLFSGWLLQPTLLLMATATFLAVQCPVLIITHPCHGFHRCLQRRLLKQWGPRMCRPPRWLGCSCHPCLPCRCWLQSSSSPFHPRVRPMNYEQSSTRPHHC